VDETGVIAHDRIFAVGVLKLAEPSRLLRALQKFRDRHHWYKEIKFADITGNSVDLYKEVADICLAALHDVHFFCFVADRDHADPITRFGSHWDAYSRLAEQLMIAAIKPAELVSVVADNYSTPDHVLFEENLKANVNRRLHRLAVVSVCRMDSRSSDGLQAVDLLTSATAYEFRQAKKLASASGPKHEVAVHIRAGMGADTCLDGHRNMSHSVAIYGSGAS
jgi:hypothetical protein